MSAVIFSVVNIIIILISIIGLVVDVTETKVDSVYGYALVEAETESRI